MSQELLDRWAADARRAEPPQPRAGLRADILKYYDANIKASRAAARARRSLRGPRIVRIAAAAAAAALITISIYLAIGESDPRGLLRDAPPVASAGEVAAPAAATLKVEKLVLQKRIEALRAALAQPASIKTVRSSERVIVQTRVARQNEKQVRTIQSTATLTSQPVEPLYRLVSARLFERVDKNTAIARYRELLKDYPEGPACAVARERLRELNP